jgi:hypothetical protein
MEQPTYNVKHDCITQLKTGHEDGTHVLEQQTPPAGNSTV